MQRQRRGVAWKQPIIAWLVAFIMVAVIFASQGITPFGNHNLLIGDLGTQYTAFFTGFVRLLRQHAWTVYNFQSALGASWVPMIAYYLMSPFNGLLFLFRESQIPVAVALIIMLKIATIAGSMTAYLQAHWQSHRAGIWLFGLVFAFCGFVTANFFNLMWLDALITLPLVAWGIDRLVRSGRSGLYFGALVVTILVNYYMGYMVCLFAIGYLLYTLGLQTNQRLNRDWWRHNRHLINRFVATSLLSGMSTLFLLLPTVFGMLEAPKVAAGHNAFAVTPLFGLEFFSQFQMGASNFAQRLSHGPAIFVSSLVSLLAVAYFALPQVKRRDKWWSAGLLAFLFLGMWIRGFNTFWHMLSVPASYPFRNSFLFSFVLVLLAGNAWQAGVEQLARRWRWRLSLGLALLMGLGAASIPILRWWPSLARYARSLQPWNWFALICSLVSLGLMACLIWAVPARYQWTIASLVVLELGANFIWALGGANYGSQRQFARAYQAATQQLRVVRQSRQLYRVRYDVKTLGRGFTGSYHGYNDPIWLGVNGTNAYSSTTQTKTVKLARQLGLFVKDDRRLSNQGFTPVTEMLWGVRLKVDHRGTQPVGSYQGMGFATTNRLTALKLGTDPLTNQEAVLQALRPSERPYFVPVKRGVDRLRVTHAAASRQTYNYHHVLRITPHAAGRLYLVDPSGQSKFSTLSVNHHAKAPAMYADGTTTVINLGKQQRGRTLLLKFATKTASLRRVRLVTLRPGALKKAQQTLNGHALLLRRLPHHFKTTYVGHVMATTQTPDLFLSLPTESGWQVRVDGRPVTTRLSLTGLSSIAIRPGRHRIAISYQAPGAILGLIMSLLSLAIYAVTCRLKRL
ncbi:hypothetical protein D1831_09150 [Lactiplantibacillus garii]|uniref:YfhO family protein n=1 Tax=Lactiplantibacillus garii TaxID=2306423 RepID=A0A426D6R7_9LACO|nr:YfhO family protein [Lactiplantibacillus garii]RRK10119.1 hypothetical protein D1831_09150 [Lactiplantibacillus garii]